MQENEGREAWGRSHKRRRSEQGRSEEGGQGGHKGGGGCCVGPAFRLSGGDGDVGD